VSQVLQTQAIRDGAAAPAGRFRLAVRPNPFNPATHVTYEVPSAGQVELRIYDVEGGLVRTLLSGPAEAGLHTALFDGRNDGGQEIASGTYFLKLEAAGLQSTQKLSLVR
jgi:hypothetical protein